MEYTYTIEKKPKSVVELTVTLPIAEIKPKLAEAANKISENLKIDGFRPGHMPYDIVKGKVGELAIYEEASGKLIEKSYVEIIVKEKLEPVGSPAIALEKIAPDNDVVYKATVSLVPKVTLGDYKKIKVKQQAIKLEDKDVQRVIDDLREMRSSEVLENKAIESGDKAEIDFEGFLDNIPFEGGSAKKYPLLVGKGQFIPGFEENLIGLKAGEEKEFKIKFPADYGVKNLAGKETVFKVKVHGVYKRTLPELNDEFVKNFGLDSVDKFKSQIKHTLYHEQEQKRNLDDDVAILEKLIDISEFEEMPEILINAEVNKMMEELNGNVAREGLKFEDYLSQIKKTVEQLKLDFIPDAIKRVKTAIAVRSLFFAEKLQIDPQEVERELAKVKLQYTSNPEAIKQIESKEYREHLENLVGNRKVMELLKNACLEKAKDEHECSHEH